MYYFVCFYFYIYRNHVCGFEATIHDYEDVALWCDEANRSSRPMQRLKGMPSLLLDEEGVCVLDGLQFSSSHDAGTFPHVE